MILDPAATRARNATIGLHLADSNDLTFPGGVKSVTQDVSIGPNAVRVSFSKKVNGGGAGLKAFMVAMRDSDGNDLVTTFVRIE